MKKQKILKPTVIVGIPAYNEEANIRHLLKSILTQTEDNYFLKKIIVISDGSVDSTCEKVASVGSRKVKLIKGNKRLGQNRRQNQIIKLVKGKCDLFLLIEADMLLEGDDFIHEMVDCALESKKFSIVVSDTEPVIANNHFMKIVNFGFRFRKELFMNLKDKNNLYLSTGARVFSKKFLENFKWSRMFHEDSYCYREAKKSKLPIKYCKKARVLFKSVGNLDDYLLQSVKFQKAREKESLYSDAYLVKYNYKKVVEIVVKHFVKNPLLFINYLVLVFISRIKSLSSPKYTPFWKTYKTTKKIHI